MITTLNEAINQLFKNKILYNLEELWNHPLNLITTIIDIIIVIFLFYEVFKAAKNTRAWQLIKGILILVFITLLSGWLKLNILNYILSSLMIYGAVILIVIFQPELRRGLEQLGTSKFTKFFGFDKNIENKTKENIYKIAIAVSELSKQKTGALIVIERDIKIKDIINTGIIIDGEISPQLLVNIFVPNTPLHDGAVIISEGKIASASCMLPLSADKDIARELGTRHRAAIGMSKESDAIVVVVSEETGKISIAKDGTLIADVKEEVLKKILIKNLINEPKIQKNKENQANTNKEKEEKQ